MNFFPACRSSIRIFLMPQSSRAGMTRLSNLFSNLRGPR